MVCVCVSLLSRLADNMSYSHMQSRPIGNLPTQGEQLDVKYLPNTIAAMLMYWYRLRPEEWETPEMHKVWTDFISQLIEKCKGRKEVWACVRVRAPLVYHLPLSMLLHRPLALCGMLRVRVVAYARAIGAF